MRRELKIFGYKITIAGLFAFGVTGLLLGLLNEAGKDIYQAIKSSDYEFINTFVKSILSFLFSKIEINVLTIIASLALAIPTYRLLNRHLFSRFIHETLFNETFRNSNHFWNLNFWGSTNPTKTNRIEAGKMIFEASPQEWKYNTEGGAYYDLLTGIQQGLSYQVSCKVKSAPGTTMAFRLWLHDARGNQSAVTGWETPPTDDYKTYELNYIATESNAIRIHLHCKSGQGQIFVSEVKVVRK